MKTLLLILAIIGIYILTIYACVTYKPKIILERFPPKLSNHFTFKELRVITAAAERNNCVGFDRIILFAIKKVENGREGFEFGITCSKHYDTDLNGQAACAAVTIVNNRQRWIEQNCDGSFVEFLGRKYCPENSKSWIGMVKYWVAELN
jgi:hypothetical protein